jgi:hypothetical protein
MSLGHHHDHMTTCSQRDAARSEPYAEAYARRYADLMEPLPGDIPFGLTSRAVQLMQHEAPREPSPALAVAGRACRARRAPAA